MRIQKIIFLSLCLTLSTLVWGQGKFYTRKARLEDFPNKITKVVLSGEAPLELAFRDEVSIRWTASPYEFCTPQDYEQLKDNKNFYFLRLGIDEGISFLLLEKGGKSDDNNRIDRGFEVLRLPISDAFLSDADAVIFMEAFVDIIQQQLADAMESDRAGYLGLERLNAKKLKGKTICLDKDKAYSFFMDSAPDILVPLSVAPYPEGAWCYKMLIDSQTHELFYFNKVRYRTTQDKDFSEKELSAFKSRHADFLR